MNRQPYYYTALLALFALLFSVHPVYAQQTFRTFASTIIDLIQVTIPVVMALAFAVFLMQGAKLVLNASSDKNDQKKALFWSLVAVFVMVSVWGIVEVIKLTFLP